MKKAFALILFIAVMYSQQASAQTLPDYAAFKLAVKEDYNDAANDAAKQASNYILSTPIVKDDVNRLKSMQYLMKWMEGSPKYNFSIDDAAKPFLDDTELFSVYLSALVQIKLTQPEIKDEKKICVAAAKQTLDYISKYQVKAKRKVREMVEADKKGTLEQELYKTKG